LTYLLEERGDFPCKTMFWKKNKKRKQEKATNHGGGGEVLKI